jgi:hypothetical protein
MCLSRRDMMKAAFSASMLAAFKGRDALAQAGQEILWVQVMANGGWDQLLFTDPKRGLRDYGTSTVRQQGNITYVDFPQVAPFFQAHASRMLVFNGVDTFTNNHDVGVRHSMSGSMLEGFPVFPAQVAASLGADRLLPMFTAFDYNEAGGLIAANPIDWRSSQGFDELKAVERPPNVYRSPLGTVSESGTPFLPAAVRTRLDAAHVARTQRLHDAATLPGHRKGAAQYIRAHAAAKRMPELVLNPTVTLPAGVSSASRLGQSMTLGAAAIDGFSKGLVTSLLVGLGNFDTHGETDADHLVQLQLVFQLADFLLVRAQAANVPMGVVMCSDFGRTVPREGATGTGHWPISSMIVAQNDRAFAQGRLPGNRVVGGTTGEAASANPDPSTVLRARKVNPMTLAFDDVNGTKITPAHVYRLLRRAAGVETAAVLRDFPLNIEGNDLVVS